MGQKELAPRVAGVYRAPRPHCPTQNSPERRHSRFLNVSPVAGPDDTAYFSGRPLWGLQSRELARPRLHPLQTF